MLPLGDQEGGGRESSYTQPMIYPVNIYMMLFNDLLIYFVAAIMLLHFVLIQIT